ncbi:MAG: hypothetical protein Q4B01_07715 [Eubacteriales bacterium]|nr:hypothetical protein [Eubacteriales bacterium]
MEQKKYEVELTTPLGKRRGNMDLTFEDGKVEGVLCLFRNSEPVTGWIKADGSCALQGEFHTLLNKYSYDATGKICDGKLSLMLYGKMHNYRMEGQELSDVR